MGPLRLMMALAGLLMATPAARGGDDAFFETKIRPILAGICFKCHGRDKTSGELEVGGRESLLKGGQSGPAIVPGNPAESLLVRALRYADDAPHMPPDKQLPAAQIRDFETWIQAGAAWPAEAGNLGGARHWAFEPVQASPPPSATVDDLLATDGGNPIDRFVLAKLHDRGLEPLARADKRTLIRRATFDLIGLPPTPGEVEGFLADESPAAFQKVVERLLASPHYGEKWGRHWLDVARYADTAGETADFPATHAWRYRNYVVGAFNADKPYDQFVREQIAGDVLAGQQPDIRTDRYAELVTATGYIAISRRFGFDVESDHYLTIDDTLDTLGKSIMGLTVGCARCHDHKYDPISMADYYGLYGIFSSTRYSFPGCEKNKVPRDMMPLVPPAEQNRVVRPVEEQSTALDTSSEAARQPDVPLAYAVAEGSPQDVRIHLAGDPQTLGDEAPRRFLEVLGGYPVSSSGSGRLELAQWLADRENPLTARVMVNRIWQHHFGTGLVETPNDFGTRGSPPTHPELLDYLADRFMDQGWSIKAMHRLIMSSEAYRRASFNGIRNGLYAYNQQADPGNSWLWRFQRRRLTAEEIRDAILAVSGDLDRTRGGPHLFPDEKTWGFTQHNPFSAVYDHRQRSVYLMTQRIKRHPFLALFDGADASASTPDRYTTTVPTQALYFLNDPFVHERAASLAARLLELADESARIELAYRLLYARPPMAAEVDAALQFVAEYSGELMGVPEAERTRTAWAAWLRVMLGSNEFLYLD